MEFREASRAEVPSAPPSGFALAGVVAAAGFLLRSGWLRCVGELRAKKE